MVSTSEPEELINKQNSTNKKKHDATHTPLRVNICSSTRDELHFEIDITFNVRLFMFLYSLTQEQLISRMYP